MEIEEQEKINSKERQEWKRKNDISEEELNDMMD